MTALTLNLTPAEIDALAAEAAAAGAESAPAFAAGLLRARWAEMPLIASCATCALQADCSATVGDNDYCAMWREVRPPAQEQPREGVAVEEGEAGAVWLGANNAKEGAAIFIADIIHRLQIIPAWMDDDEMSVDDRWNNTPPYLNGAQLRALADHIANLYQCADCHYWYRGGTICPHCGKERSDES